MSKKTMWIVVIVVIILAVIAWKANLIPGLAMAPDSQSAAATTATGGTPNAVDSSIAGSVVGIDSGIASASADLAGLTGAAVTSDQVIAVAGKMQ